jgi:hypothetical protein
MIHVFLLKYQVDIQNHGINRSSHRLKRRLSILLEDLYLLGSIYVAHLIIWRTLRRWRKEGITTHWLG